MKEKKALSQFYLIIIQKGYFVAFLLFLATPLANASENTLFFDKQKMYLAQQQQYSDPSDTYDPFTDYSEFQDTSTEEADIYFFKHGRLLSLGALGGMRMATQTLGQHARPGFIVGGFFSFFFNMRIALQFHYITGIHPFRSLELEPEDPNRERFINEMQLSQIGFDLKYYLNTQNITQGLASFNPYFTIGGSSITRRIRFRSEGTLADGKRVFGFHGGLGIEFPLTLNKVFFGIEAQYQFVKFPTLHINENIVFNLRSPSHLFRGVGILGINF